MCEYDQEDDGEYVFQLDEDEHVVGELGLHEITKTEPNGIKLIATKEENDDEKPEDAIPKMYSDHVHRVLFTNKKMVCFLGSPESCKICSGVVCNEKSAYCTRGLYAEYFNCTTNGASAEARTFMITMSDVIMAEQLEQNPEKDVTENLEEAEEAFKDLSEKAEYVVGMLGEFTLLFECQNAVTSTKLYELFGQGNILCDDPEEIGGGMLEDLEDEDEYEGMNEAEIEQRMLADMKQATEELVNDQPVTKKRDPLKPAETIAEEDISKAGNNSSMMNEEHT